MHTLKSKPSLLVSSALLSLSLTGLSGGQNRDFPNILWIVSEDNSAFLGCYGDKFATTPVLDKLAEEGFLYTHAYANAPVCAPARNTIITGVYANSNGHQHHRSYFSKSGAVTTYPELLRKAGYYCTNNAKTDYNTRTIDPDQIWDESSNNAHYKNRASGQPFFAIFNTGITHEGRNHRVKPPEELRHDPRKVPLPPYHPDTPEMRQDWAQYYDRIEEMDALVGELLTELEESGEADNTIVFYYSDHGGVLARSKRYVYETGTRVPFIVRIPEKYKHLFPSEKPGSKVNRLISFVDLAPTLLSIAGVSVPGHMQGIVFLGDQKTKDPEYVYMFRGRIDGRTDMSRAVRDRKFRYIRNYMPHRIYGQNEEYLWKATSIRSWEKAWKEGKCNEIQSVFWNKKPVEELYDTENDPWEVNNLANDPDYKDVLARMRTANRKWVSLIKDTGFIPEGELARRTGATPYRPLPNGWINADSVNSAENIRLFPPDIPIYDYMRFGKIDLEPIIVSAEIATWGKVEYLQELQSFLKNDESAIRYWGVTGLLILGEKAVSAKEDLIKVLADESPSVAMVSAEALYNLGEKEVAKKALLSFLESPSEFDRWYALEIIDNIDEKSPEIKEAVKDSFQKSRQMRASRGEYRAIYNRLIEKWGLDLDE